MYTWLYSRHRFINCLDHLKTSDESLFLNLATGTGYSVLEILQEVKRQSGIKIPFKFTRKREGDPSVVISKSKYNSSPINWKPENSDLESIITSVLSIYKIKKTQ